MITHTHVCIYIYECMYVCVLCVFLMYVCVYTYICTTYKEKKWLPTSTKSRLQWWHSNLRILFKLAGTEIPGAKEAQLPSAADASDEVPPPLSLGFFLKADSMLCSMLWSRLASQLPSFTVILAFIRVLIGFWSVCSSASPWEKDLNLRMQGTSCNQMVSMSNGKQSSSCYNML